MQERNPGTEIMPAQPFDAIRKTDAHGEHWSARDLQPMLGYQEWRNFESTIDRAKLACANSGSDVASNFGDANKVSGLRGPSQADYRLTRYGCYLVAMNGDPRKREIAAAQTYFAVKTREAEVAQSTSGIDLIIAMAQELKRAEQTAQRALESSEVTNARLDAIEGKHDWFAGLAYAKLNGLPTSTTYLQRLGKAAGKIGRARGLSVSKVQHGLYGEVNQWPVWVWELAVEERRAS